MKGSYIHVPSASKIPNEEWNREGTREPDGHPRMLCLHEVDVHLQALNIEERKVTIEPMEDLLGW